MLNVSRVGIQSTLATFVTTRGFSADAFKVNSAILSCCCSREESFLVWGWTLQHAYVYYTITYSTLLPGLYLKTVDPR